MHIVTPGFTGVAQAQGQYITSYLEISWDGLGAVSEAMGSSHWDDETDYLISFNIESGITLPGNGSLVTAGSVGTADITVSNATGRFDSDNNAGALHTFLSSPAGFVGKLIRVWQGYRATISPEYVPIFTGVITSATPSTSGGTVRLRCNDIGWVYLQAKRSTPVYADYRPDTWIRVLAGMSGISLDDVFDPGIYSIPFCWMDDESIVEEIWQAAEADCGLTYFNSKGFLCFLNLLNLPSRQTVWTFDEGSYQGIETTYDISALATKITVEWSGRAKAPEEIIYTLDQPKSVPPYGSINWVARFRYAVTGVFQSSIVKPHNDYAATSLGGVDITSYLTVAISDVYAQQAKITVTNGHGSRTANIVNLQLRGMPLSGNPSEQIDVMVTPAPLPYERIRSARGNMYMQTQAQGNALASLLAHRCAKVHPVWTITGVPGIPQLELCDRVTLIHTLSQGADNPRDCYVVGISSAGGIGSGFMQTLKLWDANEMLPYDDYFIIGQSALGTDGARCYF
jgi:hypothetical protein